MIEGRSQRRYPFPHVDRPAGLGDLAAVAAGSFGSGEGGFGAVEEVAPGVGGGVLGDAEGGGEGGAVGAGGGAGGGGGAAGPLGHVPGGVELGTGEDQEEGLGLEAGHGVAGAAGLVQQPADSLEEEAGPGE